MTPDFQDVLTTTASSGDINQLRIVLTAGQESPYDESFQKLQIASAKSSQLDLLKFLLSQHPSIPLDVEVVRGAVNAGSIPITTPDCDSISFSIKAALLILWSTCLYEYWARPFWPRAASLLYGRH